MIARGNRQVRWTAIAPLLCLPLLSVAAMAQDAPSKPTVHNLREIGKALADCMQPLGVADQYQGMRVTVRIGFNARGRALGLPRFTYMTRDAPDKIKTEYRDAIADAIQRCTPVPFSSELGATIAGLPMILRFDQRGLIDVIPGVSSAYVAPAPLPSSQMPPAQPIAPTQPPPSISQEPPIWLPGLANPVPSLPHGPETSQDRRARCTFQSGLYNVPLSNLPQYMGLCAQ